MIKIGEFAKLGGVSIKTLRHYDRLALLKPARVDHYSGYRYYELNQLQRLNEIMLFKLMGFSLESVSHLLAQNSPEELAEMLGEQEARLRDQQQEVQERLAWLRSNRLQWQSSTSTVNSQIVLKQQPSLSLITLKEMIIMEDRLHRQQTIARLLRQLDDVLPDGRQWREEPFWVMLECEHSEADSD
ncbi:MAG TPA: MerR family transcriptional regulator, partial [Chloroflexi bacterium]|nr:MerR family transcriptional regulator [Chloroflexota bacterium]